ncbi:hypothetical protein [Corallococcus exiguus]|uniref:hypothetical protein n=1 Tax=Corallococcus exiguus TaxID=83462 RepID=UPI0015611F13|nr:hypothetical protein [Corallococcus exiguus]NRD58778.1 hypothetical protein [Corallococcus exiguus]
MSTELGPTNEEADGSGAKNGTEREQEALHAILTALRQLDDSQRQRIVEAVLVFYGLRSTRTVSAAHETQPVHGTPSRSHKAYAPSFTEDRTPSPKEFLLLKAPKSDVERISCLAYYITHYRNIPHFKTPDLVSLNTEAAQPRFADPSNSTKHAVTGGYLTSAPAGQKQLSAAGEQFVLALPDREAARQAMEVGRRKKRKGRGVKQSLIRDEAGTHE